MFAYLNTFSANFFQKSLVNLNLNIWAQLFERRLALTQG